MTDKRGGGGAMMAATICERQDAPAANHEEQPRRAPAEALRCRVKPGMTEGESVYDFFARSSKIIGTICRIKDSYYLCTKGDKSEICVVQSICVGESSFFLLYIVLAASSRRPNLISST